MNHTKYTPAAILDFPQRVWPSKRIERAPIWCSVDLRDGNQSLKTPMTLEQKLKFFQFLVDTGFKEIEVGFPAASETEFQFVRTLIEQNLIPNDVTIQVLTQSREAIIQRTFESLKGVRKATVHLYNATCPLFRDVVFQKSKDETAELAVFGAKLFNTLADEMGAECFNFEYSPECFSQTELDFAVDVCNAVLDVWKGRSTIINLPFTVETFMPNVHADMIEYMCNNIQRRDETIISLHAHNDRGTAVAATELCLLAGADRVEGTLFGNGERTGNADIVTLAMNLYSQGIDPGLDFSNIDKAIEIYEKVTVLPVHPRHPYAGELVYTAFSGSHQDAIRKGMASIKGNEDRWAMPYLPIDPMDVGRSYDPIIRINSQSGSSSVAYVLETHYGIHLPKPFQRDFGPIVTKTSQERGLELSVEDVYKLFEETYINLNEPIEYLDNLTGIRKGEIEQSSQQLQDSQHLQHSWHQGSQISCSIIWNGIEQSISGNGDGVLSAFCHGLAEATGIAFDIEYYSQHALEAGKQARAIAYIGVSISGKTYFGVGVSRNVTTSHIRGVVSAVNRSFKS